MATITELHIPDEFYERLVDQARLNRRAVEDELVAAALIAIPEKPTVMSVEQKLRVADELRARTPDIYVTEAFIRAARDGGRA